MPTSYSANKTTKYEYNLDGKLVKLTVRSVVDEVERDQVMRWVYGTTLDDSDVASNELLRAQIFSYGYDLQELDKPEFWNLS